MDRGYELGTTRLVEWTGLHDEPVQGALLLPAAYVRGHRYPLIVYQYPFFRGSLNLHAFGLASGQSSVGNWQFFATRGYAVLVPDLPLRSMKISEIAGQLERAVDRVVELGVADPKRVGIRNDGNGIEAISYTPVND